MPERIWSGKKDGKSSNTTVLCRTRKLSYKQRLVLLTLHIGTFQENFLVRAAAEE